MADPKIDELARELFETLNALGDLKPPGWASTPPQYLALARLVRRKELEAREKELRSLAEALDMGAFLDAGWLDSKEVTEERRLTVRLLTDRADALTTELASLDVSTRVDAAERGSGNEV
jgi:hypothetical protein